MTCNPSPQPDAIVIAHPEPGTVRARFAQGFASPRFFSGGGRG
jgi:hypothetical protein